MLALVPRGWLLFEWSRNKVISCIIAPDSFIANPQFAFRVLFLKSCFSPLSLSRCFALSLRVHLLTRVRQSFHLASSHHSISLIPVSFCLVCSVSPEVLSIPLHCTAGHFSIPPRAEPCALAEPLSLKMPLCLLLVTIFSWKLPQWAPSKPSRNAPN